MMEWGRVGEQREVQREAGNLHKVLSVFCPSFPTLAHCKGLSAQGCAALAL